MGMGEMGTEISRAQHVADIARSLSGRHGLGARVGHWEASEMIALARSGTALIAEIPGGWVVVSRGRFNRIKLTSIRGQVERSAAATSPRLRREIGGASANAVLLEPEFGLESLASRATGSNSPWRRLFAVAHLESRDLIALVAYAIVLGGLSLAVPVAVQVLVNTIALGSLLQPLLVLSALLLGVLLLSGIVEMIRAYAVEILQRRVFVRVAEDFARRLPRIDYAAHDRMHAPELTNRFFEVVGLQKSMSRLLVDGLGLFLQTIVGMLLLGFYHPVLLAFDVALTVALAVVVFLGYGAVDSAVRESKAKYRVGGWLQQVAAQPVLFGREAGTILAAAQADALTRDYLGARRAHFGKLLRQLIGGLGIQVLAMVGLLGLGGWLVMQGELTLGQLVAAELVVGVIGLGFAKAGKHFESCYDLLASLDKVGVVLDKPLGPAPGRGEDPDGPLAIALEGVVVGSMSPALNLDIHAGARVVLRGTGGTGKTALLEALAGLRPPGAGSIRFANGQRSMLTPRDVSEATWLLRPNAVIEGSVLENLRLGDLDLEESEAWVLLRAVGLEARVAGLDGQLRARLQPSGGPLSSSEVARLALARALASRPRVLLVDGVLDQLGLSGDAHRAVLEHVMGGDAPWTAIVVSTREDVASRCDLELSLGPRAVQEVA